MTQQKILNAVDTARMLGISMSTLYKMTSANKIPYYRPSGKLIYFKEEEIYQWLDKGRVSSEAEIQRAIERYCKQDN